MINEELIKLYETYLPELEKIYFDLDAKGITNYTIPFIPYCWEEDYLKSPYKIVFYGQETNGWHDEYIRSVEDIIRESDFMKSFNLGEDNKTSFWQIVEYINKCLNSSNQRNYIWSNVCKFGKADGKGRPDDAVRTNEKKHFNILSKEISIYKPEVCIFLTGPNYDEDLKYRIADLQFLEFTQNEDKRYVSKLQSEFLPTCSYRINHPGYGLRYREWYFKIIDSIIEDIKQSIKGE